MKELAAIVEAYHKAASLGKRAAIATVVEVIGSSYRSPGARMLVTDDGQITGAISGGCLEGDALKKALYAIENKTKRIVVYDTTDESDASFGIQLGCNGTVSILFEPIDHILKNNPIHLIEHAIKFRQSSALVTAFSKILSIPQIGTLLAINSDEIIGNKEFIEEATSALKMGESVFVEKNNQTLFIEIIHPPVSLIICGGGNDAVPLAHMAASLGWDIIIVDGRPGYATKQRFPEANATKLFDSGNVLDNIKIDARTAILLMSHNYNYDLQILRQAINTKSFYIGILGPQKKRDKMIAELKMDADILKIHGPMGLDIGAETPAEIALSVLAEIQSELNEKTALPLRDKLQPIHARPERNEAA